MKCGICREPLLDSQLQWGLDCNRHIGHSTHESYDCNECGLKDGKVQPQSISQKQPEMTEVERRKQMSASRINEPLGASGSGVGAANGQSFVGSVLSAVSNRLAPLFSRAGAPVENLPPRELLALKIPLKEMVSKYGYDITELINDHRLNINDFFEHGYTVGEMIDAFPSRMNMKDGMTVMSLLGIQAEHFRCVPDLVSADVMAKKIGYKASDLVDRFDLKYKSPVTDGGDAWTLQELVDNGLTLADMQRAGLECEVQWDELKQTVAPLHLPQLAQRFGATPEAIASQLVSANVTKQLSAGYLQRQKVSHANVFLLCRLQAEKTRSNKSFWNKNAVVRSTFCSKPFDITLRLLDQET